MIKRNWLRALSVGATLGASVAVGSTAHASRLAQSMAGCEGVNLDMGVNFGQWAIGNVIAPNPTAVCPVDNVSGVSTGTVTVDVFKQTPTAITVKACVTFIGGGGGVCGTVDNDMSAGLRQLNPFLDAWTAHPTDYRWLLITSTTTPHGQNTVFGYRQDP
jgi:hypothetical protein